MMAIDGIFFPAAGDTVSGRVGEGKRPFILQKYVQRAWESAVANSISKSVLKY